MQLADELQLGGCRPASRRHHDQVVEQVTAERPGDLHSNGPHELIRVEPGVTGSDGVQRDDGLRVRVDPQLRRWDVTNHHIRERRLGDVERDIDWGVWTLMVSPSNVQCQ